MAQHEGRNREHEDNVVKHDRLAAQVPDVALGIIRDRQKQAARSTDPGEMVETDAREFGECDGENGEIDPADAEPECEKADDCAAGRSHGDGCNEPDPWADAEMEVQ